eukprot:jgi/Tetstr1/433379/TSEL_022664.t1
MDPPLPPIVAPTATWRDAPPPGFLLADQPAAGPPPSRLGRAIPGAGCSNLHVEAVDGGQPLLREAARRAGEGGLSRVRRRPRAVLPSAGWRAQQHCQRVVARLRAMRRITLESGVLISSAAVVVMLALVDHAYQLLAPLPGDCPDRSFFLRTGVPEGCVSAAAVSLGLQAVRIFLSGGPLTIMLGQRLLILHSRAKLGGPAAPPPPAGSSSTGVAPYPHQWLIGTPGPTNRVWGSDTPGWVVASSRQAWMEATRAVHGSSLMLLVVAQLLSFVLATMAVVEGAGEGWASGARWAYACRVCSDDSDTHSREEAVAICAERGEAPRNICFSAWYARAALPIIGLGQVYALGSIAAFLPLQMLDSIAVEASRKSGQRWLDRMRILHLVLIPSLAFASFPGAVFLAMEFHRAPRVLVELSACLQSVVIPLQLAISFWLFQDGPGAASKEEEPPGQTAAIRGREKRPCILGSRLYRAFFIRPGSSLHLTLSYLLIVILMVFQLPVATYGTAVYCSVVALRIGTLLAFFLVGDTPATFEDLRSDPDGVGFGLLVDVCMLQEALQRHLDGATPLRYLPTYKATHYRMDVTLAVSYRWQCTERFICPGAVLNMGRWQIEQLLDALKTSTCFYVWIDRLSVPQVESELQNTLLSRMMGTYASARETLVLRSLEEEGSRYHQRAWTLAEYVCSNMPLCRPMWLHPEGEPHLGLGPEIQEVWGIYERVRGILHCKVPEDRIRAVYPLFFGVPVESHDELASLVKSVASELEIQMPGSPSSLMAFKHYIDITSAAIVDQIGSWAATQRSGVSGFFSGMTNIARSMYNASTQAGERLRSAFGSVRSTASGAPDN